jgi:hypothetical protein
VYFQYIYEYGTFKAVEVKEEGWEIVTKMERINKTDTLYDCGNSTQRHCTTHILIK